MQPGPQGAQPPSPTMPSPGPPPAAYPYPPPYYVPPKSDGGRVVLIIVLVVVAFVIGTVVLSAILYLMVGGLVEGPSGGPDTIGITRKDTASNWVLEVAFVSGSHPLATTTLLMRWPANSSIVNPPGQATLASLRSPSGGVQYLAVGGSGQTVLRVSDVITISKALSYTSGMQVTISGSATILWSGTL